LPENERCTLRCSGIPVHAKEEDLKAHFESFGYVVELQISPMSADKPSDVKEGDSAEKKKVYNECLVQFYSAPNAKKCFSSTIPVLNNRFIHLHMSHFNIIPPQDVPDPGYDVIERDRQLLSGEIVPPAPGTSSASGKKPLSGLNMYEKGTTNKWRRTDEGKVAGGGEIATSTSSSTAVGVATEETAQDKPAATSLGEMIVSASKSVEPAAVVVTSKALPSKDDEELRQSFLELKSLKQQSEDILKKKEKILQVP
jgi:hypothetical protein